jgi:site-specific DNA-methyltransferase (adenine-specific)
VTPYYEDGAVTIYHGDCREVLPALAGVTAIVADPPYGIGYRTNSSRSSEGCRSRDWPPVTGDDSPFDPSGLLGFSKVVLFGANHYANRLPPSSAWLVWDKRDDLPSSREVGFNDSSDLEMAWTNGRGPARIYSHRWLGLIKASERTERRVHPTQKPVALMRWVLLATTGPRDLVCDPFAGSGTTLRAAKDLGRRAIGIEIEERYCEIAARRCGQEVLPFAEGAA